MPVDFHGPFFTETPDVCGNCGKPCESTVWVPGFEYFGCDDCDSEARIVVFAEDNCPTLYDAAMRSKSVSEVQAAFRQHQESCPRCNPKLAEIPKRDAGSALVKNERAA